MEKALSPRTRKRLDIQGFEDVDDVCLAWAAPWLRAAFAGCAFLGLAGTLLASPLVLLLLAPIAAAAAVSPVHPFDHLYNVVTRRFTGTDRLPKRGAPSRFACGMGSLWLLATAWAFWSGHTTLGYGLGISLTSVATLVATTDICIPSMMYRLMFGAPKKRDDA